jgi:hypothetical protein
MAIIVEIGYRQESLTRSDDSEGSRRLKAAGRRANENSDTSGGRIQQVQDAVAVQVG